MQLSEGINAGQGLGIEIIATFQLVLCVLATTDRRRNDVSGSAPLAIGLSVALGHLLAVSFSPQRLYLPYPTSGWASEGREVMGKLHLCLTSGSLSTPRLITPVVELTQPDLLAQRSLPTTLKITG